MNIIEAHKEYLAEQILFYILHNNLIPTAENIIELLRAKTETKDLALPESVQPAIRFEYGEKSSARKMNETFGAIYQDLNILYRSLLSIEEENEEIENNILQRLEDLKKRSQTLISKADRLLLTSENTTGLLQAVGDDFANTSRINLEETSAAIDLAGQTVHLNSLVQGRDHINDLYDLSLIRNEDISPAVLTPRASPAPGTRDSQNVDIFTPGNRAWIYTVSSDQQTPVTIEIRIDCHKALNGAAFIETKKITLDPFILNNSVTVLIQHSLDGILWKDIPSENPQRQLVGPTSFLTNGLEFKFLRIVLTRNHHSHITEQGKYIYDFGIKKLTISKIQNLYERESELQSTTYVIENVTKAALSVACEHIPSETSIDYYIAFVQDDVAGEFQKINPLNRDDLLGSLTVEAGGVSVLTENAQIDLEEREFTGGANSEIFVLNENASSGSTIWRNVGIKNAYYSTRQSDGRVTEAGWVFEDGVYKTYILIEESGGLSFDFGNSQIIIDGIARRGQVRLSKGVHEIHVAERNWYSLEGLGSVSSFDPITKTFSGRQRKYGERGFTILREDEEIVVNNYKVIDPLYPYNHKLLIEGLEYKNNFEGNGAYQIYKGAKRFASHFPNMVSLNILETSASDNRNQFSIVRKRGGDLGVAIKWKTFVDESPRELFVIESPNGDTPQGLIFKAVLKTTNPEKTPSLDGYEIRLS